MQVWGFKPLQSASWPGVDLGLLAWVPHLLALQGVHDKRQVLIVQRTQRRHLTQHPIGGAIRIVAVSCSTPYPLVVQTASHVHISTRTKGLPAGCLSSAVRLAAQS